MKSQASVRKASFRIVEDTGVQDWRQRYADGSSQPAVVYQQRIAVAEKGDFGGGTPSK
jgi:hypothetical protein